jgi:hypothetical protein
MVFNTNINAKSITDTSATTLRTELVKMIQNPNLRENGITEADVQIQFTIDQKGEIQIIKIDAENEYLSEFIRKKLDNQRIDIKNIRNDKVYYLQVKFELV